MYISIEELKRATELTRNGKLMEATSAIQRALEGLAPGSPDPHTTPPPRENPRAQRTEAPADVTDVAFRELPSPAGRSAEVPPAEPAARGTEAPGPSRGDAGRPRQEPGKPAFTSHRFSSGGLSYNYRLYVPPRTDDTPLPVIVMLHGCTQDAGDFAAGTAMNEMAAQRGCIVVYPEQPARSNSMRCWNWFDPAHQQRGRGEPAMIAALATHVVQRCNGDAQRVYVAGLSAGGAMAVLVAQLYPEVFAAAGVHSGLPAGAATDVPSAHAVMRKGARKPGGGAASKAAVPTIVFHGRADRTVHPDNGRHVIEDAAACAQAAGIALQREQQQVREGGRSATRTVYKGADEIRWLEHWEVAAGVHAWSGGNPGGSHTDPSGPSASAAMVDFFLAHRRARQEAPPP